MTSKSFIRKLVAILIAPVLATLIAWLFSAFLRKAPMRHETYWLAFAFLIYLPSDIIML